MLKYYNTIFLLLLCIIISPVHAANTVCTPCPQQTPYIVYVTVTVTVPVPATPTPAPTQSKIDLTPTTPPQSNIISQLTTNKEYLIYGFLFLLLIGGIIYMRIKQKRKKPPIAKIDNNISELYEETEEIPEIKEEPKKPEKQKKPKSLLDQDFEF